MKPSREPATHNRQTYTVTAATWGRRNLFAKEPWAKLLLDTLFDYRRQNRFLLHAFVLMPDHVHLLLTPAESLERAAQLIKGGYSYRAKRELGTTIKIWQRGFSHHRLRDVVDWHKHLEYIHMNPVRAGIALLESEYPYSSAFPGFTLDPAPAWLAGDKSATLSG